MTHAQTKIRWVSASVQKAGNRQTENEDAVATAPDGLRFAVADGATEGWESGPWAARLASAYVAKPPDPTDFPVWLASVRQGWSAPAKESVPWYAAEKQEEGSFATLAGLELRQSKRGTGWAWRAVAIGDSCLLHVRSGRVETAFPLTSPKEFGHQPALVPSSPSAPCPTPQWLAGRVSPGDLLLLATDAVAVRLLSLPDPAAWQSILDAIRDALHASDSAALLERLREFQTATNDDMTLVAIRIPTAPELL
jgi:hypothetical protein